MTGTTPNKSDRVTWFAPDRLVEGQTVHVRPEPAPDLVAFVTERLDEREALAERIWDTAHVLREVAAMRAILDVIVEALADDVTDETAQYMARHLAAIWSEHPDYHASYAP